MLYHKYDIYGIPQAKVHIHLFTSQMRIVFSIRLLLNKEKENALLPATFHIIFWFGSTPYISFHISIFSVVVAFGFIAFFYLSMVSFCATAGT
jgi:hypothetical protein